MKNEQEFFKWWDELYVSLDDTSVTVAYKTAFKIAEKMWNDHQDTLDKLNIKYNAMKEHAHDLEESLVTIGHLVHMGTTNSVHAEHHDEKG